MALPTVDDRRCIAFKKSGYRCGQRAARGSDRCHAHDPDLLAALRTKQSETLLRSGRGYAIAKREEQFVEEFCKDSCPTCGRRYALEVF